MTTDTTLFTDLSDTLKVRRLYNDSVIEFQILSKNPDTINLWADTVIEDTQNWHTDRPWLVIYDFSTIKGFATTPLFRKRAKEAAMVRPELDARTAVVFDRSIVAHIIQVLMRSLPQHRESNRERRLFFDRDEALNWVLEWHQQEVDE